MSFQNPLRLFYEGIGEIIYGNTGNASAAPPITIANDGLSSKFPEPSSSVNLSERLVIRQSFSTIGKFLSMDFLYSSLSSDKLRELI